MSDTDSQWMSFEQVEYVPVPSKEPEKKLVQSDVTFVVSFDPGVVNLGVAGILSEKGKSLKLDFYRTYNVKSDDLKGADRNKLFLMLEEIDALIKATDYKRPYLTWQKAIWVVEYQPPLESLRNPGLVRSNTFVESFIIAWCMARDKQIHVVYPSAVKTHFDFPKTAKYRQYALNKQTTTRLVSGLLGVKGLNEHICDCVLNGAYFISKHQEKEEAIQDDSASQPK